MKFNPKLAIVYAATALTTSAFALTPAEHTAEKQRISAEYKAAKEQCKTLKGNAKDVCEEQAKGAERCRQRS
jgi:cell division protein FtsB